MKARVVIYLDFPGGKAELREVFGSKQAVNRIKTLDYDSKVHTFS